MRRSRGHTPKGPSQRQLRVGEQIRHMVVETLQRGHFQDEILLDNAQNVTVSEVRISPDLKNATAYVITLGGKDMDIILPALNEAAYHFQKEISRASNLKFIPRIQFKYDDSFDEAQRIEKLLMNRDVQDDIHKPDAEPDFQSDALENE